MLDVIDTFRNVLIKIIWISALLYWVMLGVNMGWELVLRWQARQLLSQDIHILSLILEDENCLDNTVIGGQSSYMNFVEGTLRKSETDYFKYDVSVSRTGSVTNNSALGTTAFSGVNSNRNPLQVQYTDYTTCCQRGDTIEASLTINVYTPVFFKNKSSTDDSFSRDNNRKLTQETMTIKVRGNKFYKGRS